MSDDITAVHVTIEQAESEKVRQKWKKWSEGVRLVMLDSPYRLFVEPLLDYVADIAHQRQPSKTITIVVPEFVSKNRLSGALHMNTADLLRSQLKNQPGIIIASVPYHVHEKTGEHLEKFCGGQKMGEITSIIPECVVTKSVKTF